MTLLKKLENLKKRKNRIDELHPVAYHLAALRRLLASIAAVFVLAFFITFFFSDEILSWIILTAGNSGYRMVYLSPQEIMIQQFRIAGMGALLFGAPFILFCLYCFVRIALNKRERRFALAVASAGYLCFWAGLYFVCRLVFPLMLQFFIGVNQGYDIISTVSVKNFIDLYFMICVIFGVITELPVVCVFLAAAGILTTDRMRMVEKPVIVAAFVIGAVITPPDIISQLLVAVPVVMLYKVSEFLVWIFQMRHKKSKQNEESYNE